MLSVGTEIGASALRLWIAAGSAALLFVFCAMALVRPQANALLRAASVALGALCGAAIMWAVFDRGASVDTAAERRALELRADELNARGLAPGSPLSCLDALAGDTVEAACEKALFVSPASVASASSYVAARLGLLSAAVAYAESSGMDMESIVSPLRRSIEADRFGFVAHVLAVRHNCTSEACKAFALLHDTSRIRANFTEHALDRFVEQHQEAWAKPPEVAQAPSDASAQPNVPPHHLVNIDFPSAASIPPVSIMNPEPTGPVLPGVAAAAAANPNPSSNAAAAASRRTRKPAAAPQPAGQSLTGGQPVEPIWPEPMPPSPPAQANSVPAGAPVQLNPPSPSASAGPPARTQ